MGWFGFNDGVYCAGGGVVNDTITIQNPQDVPAPTLQQVLKYAETHKLLMYFDEWESLQETFNRVCHASYSRTQREIYDEMVLL